MKVNYKALIYLSILLLGNSVCWSFNLNFIYQSGSEVCKLIIEKSPQEFGRWIEVPIDYNQPSGPKTKIYSYTLKKFDATKTSVIYFIGGPGSSSHGNEFSLPNTNVIFFEQRGIGCSRPLTKELFLNPQFYSSENTAQDALMVLNNYRVLKAAIYGHSYGTVPATIFASMFPERTKSLLLEGVVFKADESLWISKRKIELMENFIHELPENKRQRILEFSARADVHPSWFSYIAKMTMAVGNFKNGLMEFLERTIFDASLSDEYLASMLNGMIPSKPNLTTPAEESGFGEITMAMISCQEMSMANPNMSHLLHFDKEHLVPDKFNFEREDLCRPLGLENIIKPQYSAELYPISPTIPTIYFLGEYDPATSLAQGLSHYYWNQSKNKQVLISMHGGHAPNLELLTQAMYCDSTNKGCTQQNIEISLFEKSIAGKKIKLQDLEKINKKAERKWITQEQGPVE